MEPTVVPVQAPAPPAPAASVAVAAQPVAASATTSVDSSFPRSGIASWYGPEFEGRPTASGERFDSSLLTAAHPTLPFGSILRVTNSQNGRKVDVRVNDRGPFVAARIIDVSRAAAEKLDMIVTGTAPVTLELVGMAGSATPQALSEITPAVAPAQTQAPVPAQAQAAPPAPLQMPAAIPATATPVPTAAAPVAVQPAVVAPAKKSADLIPKAPDGANGKRYRLQVGSYKLAQNAAEAFDRLISAGFAPSYERSGDLYRIVLVAVPAAEVVRYAERLGSAGFSQALVREER